MSNNIPPVAWAQRKDQLLVTIELQDVKDQKITLEADKLIFSGNSNKKEYAATLNLFKEIDTEKSKFAVRPRQIDFVLAKKEAGPFWDRLLKEKDKRQWLKVDWNKWKDEDEVDEDDAGFDMSGMSGMPGMGGMPGMPGMGMPGMPGMGNFDMSQFANQDFGAEEEDSDDEEIPNLEEDEKKKVEKKEEKKEEHKDNLD